MKQLTKQHRRVAIVTGASSDIGQAMAEASAQDETHAAIGWDTFKHFPEHTAAIREWMGRGGAEK